MIRILIFILMRKERISGSSSHVDASEGGRSRLTGRHRSSYPTILPKKTDEEEERTEHSLSAASQVVVVVIVTHCSTVRRLFNYG